MTITVFIACTAVCLFGCRPDSDPTPVPKQSSSGSSSPFEVKHAQYRSNAKTFNDFFQGLRNDDDRGRLEFIHAVLLKADELGSTNIKVEFDPYSSRDGNKMYNFRVFDAPNHKNTATKESITGADSMTQYLKKKANVHKDKYEKAVAVTFKNGMTWVAPVAHSKEHEKIMSSFSNLYSFFKHPDLHAERMALLKKLGEKIDDHLRQAYKELTISSIAQQEDWVIFQLESVNIK